MLSPARRFLNIELENIERERYRMELLCDRDAASRMLCDEYDRRHVLVSELLVVADSSPAAQEAVAKKLADAQMLLSELVSAADDDPQRVALAVDVEYLLGLQIRLANAIQSETFPYALAGVERL